MNPCQEYRPVPWQGRNSLFAVVLTSESEEVNWEETQRLDVYSCKASDFSLSKVFAYSNSRSERIRIVPSLAHLKEATVFGEYGLKVVLFGVSDQNLSGAGVRSRGVPKSKIEVLLCEKSVLVFSEEEEEEQQHRTSTIVAMVARAPHGNGSDVGTESSSATGGAISGLVLNLDSECGRKLMLYSPSVDE